MIYPAHELQQNYYNIQCNDQFEIGYARIYSSHFELHVSTCFCVRVSRKERSTRGLGTWFDLVRLRRLR